MAFGQEKNKRRDPPPSPYLLLFQLLSLSSDRLLKLYYLLMESHKLRQVLWGFFILINLFLQ